MAQPFEWKPRWDHEKVDESYCRGSVHSEGRGVETHQCTNSPKYDGKWCGIHRPGAAEERKAKQGPTKFEQRMAANEKHREYVADLETELDRLRELIRGLRGELSLVDVPDDLQDDPDKLAAWWARFDAETERLCMGTIKPGVDE